MTRLFMCLSKKTFLFSAASSGRPTETHELNPFGNPNAYNTNGEYGGMATTQFNSSGEGGDGGYQSQYPGRRQDSVGSTDSSFVGGEGGTERINEFQAAWNVTNAIQGMFIVSLPFAVLRGGYWAIIAMIGIAYICCYTGKVSGIFAQPQCFYVHSAECIM